MKMYFLKRGFVFSGKASDLKELFKQYPSGTTLLQFINLNIH